MAPDPVLDPEALDSLTADLGDEGAVREIVLSFLTGLSGRLGELDAAATAGRADDARRAAHTVKSGARLVGAVALAGVAESAEHGRATPDEVRAAAGPPARELRRWLAAQQLG